MPSKKHTTTMRKIRKLCALGEIYKGSTLPGIKADARKVAAELGTVRRMARKAGWTRSVGRASREGRKRGKAGKV